MPRNVYSRARLPCMLCMLFVGLLILGVSLAGFSADAPNPANPAAAPAAASTPPTPPAAAPASQPPPGREVPPTAKPKTGGDELRLRIARSELDAARRAVLPQEWYDLKAKLNVWELVTENGKRLHQQRLDVELMELRVRATGNSYYAMTPDLAKKKADYELLECQFEIATVVARMIVLDLASDTEELQRKRDEITLIENAGITLEIARKIARRQEMLDEAVTPELREARAKKKERLDKALEAIPNYKAALKHSQDVANRVRTDELVKSRERLAELMNQAAAPTRGGEAPAAP